MICPNCKLENQEGNKFCATCGKPLESSPVQIVDQPMFGNLTDFSYKRNKKGAVGFYIAYVILVMIVAGVLSAVARIFQNIVSPSGDLVTLATTIAQIVAVMATIILSGLILTKKQLLKQPLHIILALLAVVLSYFTGTILGLIVVAYFSTLESKKL